MAASQPQSKMGRLVLPGLVLFLSISAIAGFLTLTNIFALANPSNTNELTTEESTTRLEPIAKTSDHPMFGGSPSRNMVNLMETGLKPKFSLEANLLWKATLGSLAYGGPSIANGKILCGTNNQNPRNKRDRGKPQEGEEMGEPIDKGTIYCFNQKDGAFLWQAVHDKLESGMVNDWPKEGICSTPVIEGEFAYYVTNRCTVVCVDMNGLTNGNQGLTKQKYQDKTDADIIWEFNMMKDLNVFPHNLSVCSPLVVGDIVFIVTANGVDENHINIPSPEAPSFIALSKKTGKLIWKQSFPGRNIMHGQWSNVAYGVFKGVPQVIFPGGDGWLYSMKPDTGELLWKFDANPKDAKYDLGGKGTKSDFIGTPVVHGDYVYIGTGQDPEHLEGIGHFWCIDPTKRGDISPTLVVDAKVEPPKTKPNPESGAVWEFGGKETRKFAKRDYVFSRTMSTACIVDNVIYVSDIEGMLHCLNLKTGKRYWRYDLKSAIWGSAYYADGKIWIANKDGVMFVFQHLKEPETMDEVEDASKAANEKEAGLILKKVRQAVAKKYLLHEIDFEEPIGSTPVISNGVLYVLTERSLFAIDLKK